MKNEKRSNCGACEDIQHIVHNIYHEASSSITVANGNTNAIPILSGIQQGCPLSGLLFILAKDQVVSLLQGVDAKHRIIAFANDLCLITDDATSLQGMIDRAEHELGRLSLRLNVNKCVSLHVSDRRPMGVRDTTFKLGDIPM